jgi:predicted nucleotide-binding protein
LRTPLTASPARVTLARPRAEVEKTLRERIAVGQEIQTRPQQTPDDMGRYILDLGRWRDYNLDFLRTAFSDDALRREYYGIAFDSYATPGPSAFMMIPEIMNNAYQQIAKLESIIERLEFYDVPAQPVVSAVDSGDPSKVFVVHGHDEGALQAVARFLEKIELQAIVLREQPDQGRAVIEKFEACAREVGFTVILLTPDDVGGNVSAPEQSARRARQNVIFELGYFVGNLGRGRACLLRKENVEIPSDLFGVIYTDFDHPGEGWKVKLTRELKAAGLRFDAGKAFA